jgi:hypothetical protein
MPLKMIKRHNLEQERAVDKDSLSGETDKIVKVVQSMLSPLKSIFTHVSDENKKLSEAISALQDQVSDRTSWRFDIQRDSNGLIKNVVAVPHSEEEEGAVKTREQIAETIYGRVN